MPTLTLQQNAAIAAEGNVLVMAGAGTGKTSTLVARVADRLVRVEGRVPADRLLMVTFTEAAAQEMRSRLRRELEDRLAAAGGGDESLQGQLARLELARIGTLHSFCLGLLREHGALLGLDPRFVVVDEIEGGVLARESVDAAIEPWLASGNPDGEPVRSLARVQFGGDLRALRACVRSVHAYARTLPDPARWLAGEAAKWDELEPVAWRASLEAFLPEWATRWQARLSSLANNPNAERRAARLAPWIAAGFPRAGVGALLADLDEAPDEQWPARRKTECRAPLVRLFEETAFIRSHEPDASGVDPLAEDWQWCRGPMATLVRLAGDYGERFAAAKKARGAVDYQDLEQFAIDLLARGDGSVAAACRERFDLVVVDECQDLNAAQECILDAVSRPDDRANRFLVGDVKQSIYRFRLADPRVFQRAADEWSVPGAAGRVLPLTGNFRSAEGILWFVNRVFPRLMRREIGGVEYGPGAALEFGDPEGRAGLSRANDAAPRVEIHVVAKDAGNNGAEDGSQGDAADVATGAAEARVVASRFRALMDAATPVWDRAARGFRPARWSDMAVLLRSEKDRAAEYAGEFAAAGIPMQARQTGFFLREEITDLVCVLQCIDNPLQDIPLVSVLRSPSVGLDDLNELAAVRMFLRGEENWWTRVQAFREAGLRLGLRVDDTAAGPLVGEATELVDAEGKPTLSGDAVFVHPATARFAARAWHRLRRFLAWYPEWRLRAERRGVASVLEAVLDDTGTETRLEGARDGASALANVRRLLDLAREFDRGQRGGLYRFLRWIDAEAEANRIEASTGAAGDAVQLLTVHRSKGLEFPIVAVGGLGRRFNFDDFTKPAVVRDERHGLCPVVVAPDERRYPSVALWLAQRRQKREVLGEELRLLYVAMTRAADHLLLVGTASAKASDERWPAIADAAGTGALPTDVVEDAACVLDWLGPLVVADAGAAWLAKKEGATEGFVWRRWDALPTIVAPPLSAGIEPQAEAAIAFEYPFVAATNEPAKVTVTGLRKRIAADADGDDETAGYGTWMRRAPSSEPDDVSAVERGVLHHRFFEHVDFAKAGDVAGVVAEVERMTREGRFTGAEASALDTVALARFVASDLGARIRGTTGRVRREFPFTLRLDVADLRELGLESARELPDGEFVVAQGVVDLVVIESGVAWIVDYKTDRVAPGGEQAKADGYRAQLRVYALAVERILGIPVTGCWLHFLTTGVTTEV